MHFLGAIKKDVTSVRFIVGVEIKHNKCQLWVFMEENTRIACMKCKHYHVTFDPAAPRGCKLYGFKSPLMPFVLVKQSTGKDCQAFEEKVKKSNDDEGGSGSKDFNDPKYW